MILYVTIMYTAFYHTIKRNNKYQHLYESPSLNLSRNQINVLCILTLK